MISFKKFLLESIKKVSWSGNSKIGWWLDNDPITFYHGTHVRNLEFIEKHGIIAPTQGSTANWVSLALEPNTAFGYASMSGAGGERNFGTGNNVVSTPAKERIVFIIELKKDFVLSNMASERGAMQSTKGKLTNESMYKLFKGTDSQYYALTEIRMPKIIQSKYIKGYMTK